MRLEEMLDDINANLGGDMESFETANFEVENLLIARGVNPSKAKAMAPAVTASVIKTRAFQGGGGTMGNYQTGGIGQNKPYAASFTFNVTIDSIDPAFAAATSVMPVPIFGYLDYLNDYDTLASGYLPAGVVSLTVTSTSSAVIYTYTDGAAKTAVISVVCNEYPYPAFLAATVSNIFKMSKIRVSLSDKTKLQQFSTYFKPYERTIFGSSSMNTVTQTSSKSPQQFQDGILDLDADFYIDKERGILTGVNLSAGAAFIVTYSCFVEQMKVTRA